jgi:hypothetical protein
MGKQQKKKNPELGRTTFWKSFKNRAEFQKQKNSVKVKN